ncbi:hypothetical protein LMG28727_05671 [Paraburkholderia kirstenboschensis]|nr:hypothetical protein LMG28727_05671 [Paraburkholderia kirstenboschensis]
MKPNTNRLAAMSVALVAASGAGIVNAGTAAMSVEDSIDVTAGRPTVVSTYRAPPSIRLPSSGASATNNPAFAQCLPDLYCALVPAFASASTHAHDKAVGP